MSIRLYRIFSPSQKEIIIDDADAHYIRNVMRLSVGDQVSVFNETCGEYFGKLVAISKHTCTVSLDQCVKTAKTDSMTRLVYAPLKQDVMSYVFEKGSELGVTHFHPVQTEFSQNHKINEEKISRQLKSAIQQCERLQIPQLEKQCKLEHYLEQATQNENGLIYIAMERSDGISLLQELSEQAHHCDVTTTPMSLIIGPEGGFSSREVSYIHRICENQAYKTNPASKLKIIPVTLGGTILRAETAAVAGLSAISMFRCFKK